jgi:hypothetical protein
LSHRSVVGGRLQGLKRKKVFYTIREKGPVSSNLYDTSMEAFLGMLGGVGRPVQICK